MIVVIRFPKDTKPVVVTKNKCEYKVLIDLSCVAVIHDSKE